MERTAALSRAPTPRSDSFFEGCIFCDGSNALKNMGDIYINGSKEEDYDYMLHTCFGVKVRAGGAGGARLICEECVRRLREALDFRQLVLARAPASSLSTGGEETSDAPRPRTQKKTSDNQNSLRCKTSYNSSLTMRPIVYAQSPSNCRRNNQSVGSMSRVASCPRTVLGRPTNPKCQRPVPTVQCRICLTSFRLPDEKKRLSKTEMRSFVCGSCLKVLKPNKSKRSISATFKKTLRAKGGKIVARSESMTPKRGVYSRSLSRVKTGSVMVVQKPSGSTRRQSGSRMSQFSCQVCGKVFRSTHSLDLHMRKHVGQPIFQCRLCPKVYRDKRILTRHLKAVHG